jgi:uncharacterized RDD family membrane protein YckC
MFCTKCGANLPDGAGFCNACGTPVGGAEVARPPVSPATVAPAAYAAAPVAPSFAPNVAYAGFWLRVVAAIIDGFVLAIPFAPIFFIVFASMIPVLTHMTDPFEIVAALLPRYLLLVFIMGVASWLYWALLESSSWQGTLGKKAMGLTVTDLAGMRASFGKTSGRFFAGRGIGFVPSIGGLYYLISCICAGVTERKQALHDMIAGTLVLRKL